MRRTLSHQEARAFYDRFGAKQDSQGFYEDAATRELIDHARLASAGFVVEFGCGTGRFAETLLAQHLPSGARYLGVDVSSTMVELARRRLERFGARAEVRQTAGAPRIEAASGAADRFFSTYVLDLLSPEDIESLISEARRLLCEGGLLGTTGLTHGFNAASRWVERVWRTVFALRPSIVGGCRPLAVRDYVSEPAWRVVHHQRLTRFGIPSEVLVAERQGERETGTP